MKASEIINDLVGGKIKLSQAMQFARLLLLGSEYAEDLAWVTKECNGYDNKLHVPDYRQIPCQIFADYSLPYTGVSSSPVDAKQLDDELVKASGASMYTMYIVQDIESLEKMVENGNGHVLSMTFPNEIENLFRESLSSSFKVIRVYQQASSSYTAHIISSIKTRLINILLPIAQDESSSKAIAPAKEASTDKHPVVAISYSWDNDEHENWVVQLATCLQAEYGIKVVLDKWELKFGKLLPHFMEHAIRDSQRVICVMTPNYKKKTEGLEGGVGVEYSIISAEMQKDMKTEKFIPLLREGDFKKVTPIFLEGRDFIDMRDGQDFNKRIEELARDIWDEPRYKKPEIGRKPNFG